MVSTFTTNLGLEKPARGDYVDTWDVPVNSNMDFIDTAMGTVLALALTNVNVTLTAAQARCPTLVLTGVLTGNVFILFPDGKARQYTIENRCTVGAFVVLLRNAAGVGELVCAPPGDAQDVFTDGVNVRYRNMGRVGTFEMFRGLALPPWVTNCTKLPYLINDGTAFNAATYFALNAYLGGNNTPDMRGRVAFAPDNQGGVAANRITAATFTPDGVSLGATAGAQTNALVGGNIPDISSNVTIVAGGGVHAHGNASDTQTAVVAAGGTFMTEINPAGGDPTGSTQNATLPELTGTALSTGTAGGATGAAFTNIPPAQVGGISVIKT